MRILLLVVFVATLLTPVMLFAGFLMHGHFAGGFAFPMIFLWALGISQSIYCGVVTMVTLSDMIRKREAQNDHRT